MGSKKKKEKKGKKKNREEKELVKLSDNKILIRVYKHFGSNVSILKAEYPAIEKRDAYNNLISINEKFVHNEDTDFAMEDIYRDMQIILEFKNKKKSDKIDILTKKIDYQDKLLKYLDKHIELNAVFNYADEQLKSRDYKVLKNYIENHDKQGAYFTIEKGMRVYSFESVDGCLVPIWHGVDTYTKNPDHTRKIKINIQEDMRMRKEIQMFNREKKVGQIMTVGLIAICILFALLVFGLIKTWQLHGDMETEIHESTLKCAQYTADLNRQLSEIMDESIIKTLLDYKQDPPPEIKKEDKPLSPNKVLNIIK